MKKLLAILLAGMMVFSLAACGGTNGDVDVDEPGTEVSEDVVAKVGIVYGDDETPNEKGLEYYEKLVDAMLSARGQAIAEEVGYVRTK